MSDGKGILVGGRWSQAASGETMEVLNPATEAVIGVVPRCAAVDVDEAVAAASAALPEWLETTPGERAEALLGLARVLEENAEELAAIESENVGKPLSYARDEMPVCVDNLRFFAGAARVLEGKSAGEYMRGYTSMIRREPLGVVGGIAPWNYPLMMAVWKLGPALAAGNTQVLKPSEQTPLSLLRFAELAAEVLPPGVLNVVTGDGVPVGERIVTHPDVRLVSLTGDVETGKIIARKAADTLKRVHLELGGKAPVVVFDDADPVAVAEGIKIAGYWNSGQDCTAASRVVAGPKIYDRLLEELVPAVESLAVGDPAGGAEIDMGPVISSAQRDRVVGFLDRVPAATVLTGGGAPSGPWVLRHADGGRGSGAARRDRAAGGVRAGGDGAAVRRRRRGYRVGERRAVRARGVGVDARRRAGAVGGARAPVRDGVDQRPYPARLRDAARRLQGLGVREGSVGVLARGLHADQARDGEALLGGRAERADLRSRRHARRHGLRACVRVAAGFAEQGMPIDGWRIHRRIGMSGGLFTRAVAREVGRELSDEETRRSRHATAGSSTSCSRSAGRFPGAVALLAALRAGGIMHGIATSGRRPEIDESLAALEVPADMVVIDRGDVARAKPEPDLFLACAAALGIKPEHCYVVGDAVWDLLAARRAGMLSIGLLSGGYGADELLQAGAFRVYDDAEELHRSLDELGFDA